MDTMTLPKKVIPSATKSTIKNLVTAFIVLTLVFFWKNEVTKKAAINSSEVTILNTTTQIASSLMFDGVYVLDNAIKLKAINHGY